MKEELSLMSLKIFEVFDKDWALLVSGGEKPNLMTISWGGMGTIYNKPVLTVYVRPTRFSFDLMMKHPDFTVNFLPEELRKAYDICGSASGRDTDKWSAAKLTKVKSLCIQTPFVKEAKLAFECKTIARVPLDKKCFVSDEIDNFYPKEDYHTIFIGEVLKVHNG
ncbi:MAG: flavin reductase family protein [Acidobacteria bacterium]|nr:flavin reductase family protein [Acidobacteriota bacterium]